MGTNRGQPLGELVDLLLATLTDAWRKFRISGQHARTFIHTDSYRIVLEARHSAIIGKDGVITLTRLASHVLQQREIVMIGDCVYNFEYTELFATVGFEGSLANLMKIHQGPR